MEKLDNSAAEMYPHHRQQVSQKGTGPATNSYVLQYPDTSEYQQCTDISAVTVKVGDRNRQHHCLFYVSDKCTKNCTVTVHTLLRRVPPYTPYWHAGGNEVQIHSFLTSAVLPTVNTLDTQ